MRKINKWRSIALFLALIPTIWCSAADIILKNRYVQLTFASGNEYKFKSYLSHGEELLPDSGSNESLWRLDYLGPKGKTSYMVPSLATYAGSRLIESEEGQTAVFTWTVTVTRDSTPVNVYVRLGKDSELPEWSIDAELPEGWTVYTLEFPQIALKRPDGDVKVISPECLGIEYRLPDTTAIMPHNSFIRVNYPSGNGSMEMILMHKGDQTWYYAATDKTGTGKQLRITAKGKEVSFNQLVTASFAWSKNRRFSLPWSTVLGFNKADWQETALKWYYPMTLEMEWGTKTLQQREIPEWIKNADLWILPFGTSDEMMNAIRACLRYFGKGVAVHWYNWQKYPLDYDYPEYFPEQKGFKEKVEEVHKLGGYVMPYINGRIWDSTNKIFDKVGIDAACRRLDGKFYSELYTSSKRTMVTMCPSTTTMRDTIKELNRRLIKDIGVDGVYIDQIACAMNTPCYSDKHEHEKGGGRWWPDAYRSLITEIKDEICGSSNAITSEECAECYVDKFDMLLTVNSKHDNIRTIVPLFPLIYSGRSIYCGYTYIRSKVNNGSFRYITMKSLLWGSQLGWIDPISILKDENKTEAKFLKAMVEFRKGQHDLFVGGRFLGEYIPGGDNPIVDVPDYQKSNVVMGAKWRSGSGKEALILVNMSGDDHVVTLDNSKTVKIPAYSAKRLNL